MLSETHWDFSPEYLRLWWNLHRWRPRIQRNNMLLMRRDAGSSQSSAFSAPSGGRLNTADQESVQLGVPAAAQGVQTGLLQPPWRTGWRFLRKLNTELPRDPAIPLLGIHPDKVHSRRHTGSFHCGSLVMNPTSIPEDAGSIPGLTRWLQIWLCCGCGVGQRSQLQFDP